MEGQFPTLEGLGSKARLCPPWSRGSTCGRKGPGGEGVSVLWKVENVWNSCWDCAGEASRETGKVEGAFVPGEMHLASLLCQATSSLPFGHPQTQCVLHLASCLPLRMLFTDGLPQGHFRPLPALPGRRLGTSKHCSTSRTSISNGKTLLCTPSPSPPPGPVRPQGLTIARRWVVSEVGRPEALTP